MKRWIDGRRVRVFWLGEFVWSWRGFSSGKSNELFDGSQFCTSRSRVSPYLVVRRDDRLFRKRFNSLCGSANTFRNSRRAETFAGEPLKSLLDDPVLKRMKGDHSQHASNFQNIN